MPLLVVPGQKVPQQVLALQEEVAAKNLAATLLDLKCYEEAKLVLRKAIPAARRVLGANNETTFRTRKCYARALFEDPAATLDDVREAVTTLDDVARISRRVMGVANPITRGIEYDIREARAALRARETPPGTR